MKNHLYIKFSLFFALLCLFYPSASGSALASTSLTGVALQNQTNVYSTTSKETKALKSYPQGSILKFTTYNEDWYSALVYINGKKVSGYIFKQDVELAEMNPTSSKGIALRNNTNVYVRTSTDSQVLKSYNSGTILKYETFSNGWYQAKVYMNGKAKKGYIQHSDIDNSVTPQVGVKGIALLESTAVYSQASTKASQLKKYPAGTVLSYKTFASNWYEAKVYINGKPTTGYIHADHVEGLLEQKQTEQGRATKNPTTIYAKASKHANVLLNVKQHSVLTATTYSPSWFETTIDIKGKKQTGYVHIDDITTKDVVHISTYNYELPKMVDAQLKAYADTDLTKGNGWQLASRNQIEYYTNPVNFPFGSPESFQFLVLSHPAGIDVDEVNQKILANAGVLTNKAKIFVEGANKYKINEIYLIAHALLETGRGSTELATGISKWTKRNAKGEIVKDSNGKPIIMDISPKKVYNMYGIGAFNSCPNECGAQKAYDSGWFSVDEAIREGAGFVANGYINQTQDTLYKMRWNPAQLNGSYQASHQYATDVGWASKQTATIYQMYEKLSGNYVLVFDVPQFLNQATALRGSTVWQGNINSTPVQTVMTYPQGIYGIVSADKLNLREIASTNAKSIITIPKGTTLEITGEEAGQVVNNNSIWYQAKYDGKMGWVHSDYVKLLNLLEVTASSLNIRAETNTINNPIGSLKYGERVAGTLDAEDQLITTKTTDAHLWYLIRVNGKDAWISGGMNGTQYIRIK
ncbi:SH3 domain-containing protein [Bacillus niameyensis]|uniref:SH3 domain-containing protein n=1 Tax=Bacillus niameyensis TaxID=1522308 RepID=UPI00078606A6|nr:SH3 domain-containing protein [Bacillus niameyensis]